MLPNASLFFCPTIEGDSQSSIELSPSSLSGNTVATTTSPALSTSLSVTSEASTPAVTVSLSSAPAASLDSSSIAEDFPLVAVIAGSVGGLVVLLLLIGLGVLITKRWHHAKKPTPKSDSDIELPVEDSVSPPAGSVVKSEIIQEQEPPEKEVPVAKANFSDYGTEYGGIRLGGGNFGEVFGGTMDGQPVALKKLKGDTTDRDLKRELSIHQAAAAVCAQVERRLTEQKVAKAFCLWRDSEGELYFVMELCPRGSLLEVEDPGEIRLLLCSAARGLAELHRRGFLHRDIAARNILVRETESGALEAVYTDFGLATLKKKPRPFRGFPWRITPAEVVTEGRWSVASDVYSFGFLIWELLSKQRPWPALDQRPIGSSFLRTTEAAHTKPDDMSLDEYLLFLRCTSYNAGDRPGLTEVIQALSRTRVSLAGVEYPE